VTPVDQGEDPIAEEASMTRPVTTLLSLLLLLSAVPATAQEDAGSRYDAARLAWDAGRYVEAMETLEDILAGSDADAFLERIALLTGELYRVSEVAPDGHGVRWSPDGRYAVYESGSGSGTITHIVSMEAGGVRTISELPGRGLVFAPSGERVAYLTVPETEELLAARAELESQVNPGDRRARYRLRSQMAQLDAEHTRITIRDLDTGREEHIAPQDLGVSGLMYGPDGESLYFTGNTKGQSGRTDVYAIGPAGEARPVTNGPGLKENPRFLFGGTHLLYEGGRDSLALVDLASGGRRALEGLSPAVSADGGTLAYLGRDAEGATVNVLSPALGEEPVVAARSMHPVAVQSSSACAACPTLSSLAISPDGSQVAFQVMPREDWEIIVAATDGSGQVQATREVQHDLFPEFLPRGRLIWRKGEGRHRRSHLMDLETGRDVWLFRNNTLRTVSPEYEWATSPDGSGLLIVADRDGNTISPERGVYHLDLTSRVTVQEVLSRVRTALAAERDLRERGHRMFEAIADEVQETVAHVSTPRIFDSSPATPWPSTTWWHSSAPSGTSRSSSGSRPGEREPPTSSPPFPATPSPRWSMR
jgi:Tol biopolymer transport system component